METIACGVAGVVTGVVIGVAAGNLVTEPASGVGMALRGAAKGVIKGGIIIQEAASDLVSGIGGYFSDIVTEAKNELAKPAVEQTAEAKVP